MRGRVRVICACSDSLASAFRICLSALRGCALALGETPRADVSTCQGLGRWLGGLSAVRGSGYAWQLVG